MFSILFTDGQHAPWRVLRRRWQAPALALGIGMPLTFLVVAVLAHWVAGLPWPAALVVGAVLAPTDPVFASALVGREEVPHRVRSLLNVESGLNDGLALPAVLLLAGLAGGSPEGWSTAPGVLLVEVGTGVVLGVVLPLVVGLFLRIPGIESVERLRPLGPVAVAILLFGVCSLVHANQFMAAFVAGSTVATVSPQASESFRHTGELLSELTKGVALLAFATLLDVDVFSLAGLSGLVFAFLVIVVARPLPVLIALLPHRHLTTRERAAVAWFGPKGFASVAYAVIVLSSDMDDADAVFGVVAVSCARLGARPQQLRRPDRPLARHERRPGPWGSSCGEPALTSSQPGWLVVRRESAISLTTGSSWWVPGSSAQLGEAGAQQCGNHVDRQLSDIGAARRHRYQSPSSDALSRTCSRGLTSIRAIRWAAPSPGSVGVRAGRGHRLAARNSLPSSAIRCGPALVRNSVSSCFSSSTTWWRVTLINRVNAPRTMPRRQRCAEGQEQRP